jgi:membrane protease YdiL (CAAX protease family)
MNINRLLKKEWGERILLALLFVAIGWLIYLVFSPMRPLLSKTAVPLGRAADYLGRIGLIVTLLTAVLLVRRSPRFEKYGQILLGLLIMAITVSFDRIFSIYLLVYLNVTDITAAGYATLKLNEFFIVVSMVIALTLMSGGSLGSIYIQKGNLKLGLIIGVTTFLLAAAGSAWMATFLFKGQNLTLERILVWLPWLLVFVLANGAQEELLFRGLFLRKLQPFFGKFVSNFLIMFVFTALHNGANYTSNEFIFLAAVVPLALAWGYITQKTDSLWGAILFHAGMDIPIMLGIFSNLK